MNYFLLLLILIMAAGGYFEYTQLDQHIQDSDKSLTDANTQLAKLKETNDKLTKENEALKTGAESTNKSNVEGAAPTTEDMAAATDPDPALSAQLMKGIVTITGDRTSGIGFLVKTDGGLFVFTNLHLLANNPNLKMSTADNAPLTMTGLMGATDRDLAKIAVQDGAFSVIPLCVDVGSVQPGDEIMTVSAKPGVTHRAKVGGISAEQIIFASGPQQAVGGPIYHKKSGTVIGVVAPPPPAPIPLYFERGNLQARLNGPEPVTTYNGLRIDTVTKWEPYDAKLFQDQMTFLENFHTQSTQLDSFINGVGRNAGSLLWRKNQKILDAAQRFDSMFKSADDGQKVANLRDLVFALGSVADQNYAAVQEPGNFYSFYQPRAKNEADYRKALKAQVDAYASTPNRMNLVPKP